MLTTLQGSHFLITIVGHWIHKPYTLTVIHNEGNKTNLQTYQKNLQLAKPCLAKHYIEITNSNLNIQHIPAIILNNHDNRHHLSNLTSSPYEYPLTIQALQNIPQNILRQAFTLQKIKGHDEANIPNQVPSPNQSFKCMVLNLENSLNPISP